MKISTCSNFRCCNYCSWQTLIWRGCGVREQQLRVLQLECSQHLHWLSIIWPMPPTAHVFYLFRYLFCLLAAHNLKGRQMSAFQKLMPTKCCNYYSPLQKQCCPVQEFAPNGYNPRPQHCDWYLPWIDTILEPGRQCCCMSLVLCRPAYTQQRSESAPQRSAAGLATSAGCACLCSGGNTLLTSMGSYQCYVKAIVTNDSCVIQEDTDIHHHSQSDEVEDIIHNMMMLED